MFCEYVVAIFPVTAFVVVALLVEALDVMKLEEFPKRFVIYEFRVLKALAKSVPPTFRFVIEDVAATS